MFLWIGFRNVVICCLVWLWILIDWWLVYWNWFSEMCGLGVGDWDIYSWLRLWFGVLCFWFCWDYVFVVSCLLVGWEFDWWLGCFFWCVWLVGYEVEDIWLFVIRMVGYCCCEYSLEVCDYWFVGCVGNCVWCWVFLFVWGCICVIRLYNRC